MPISHATDVTCSIGTPVAETGPRSVQAQQSLALLETVANTPVYQTRPQMSGSIPVESMWESFQGLASSDLNPHSPMQSLVPRPPSTRSMNNVESASFDGQEPNDLNRSPRGARVPLHQTRPQMSGSTPVESVWESFQGLAISDLNPQSPKQSLAPRPPSTHAMNISESGPRSIELNDHPSLLEPVAGAASGPVQRMPSGTTIAAAVAAMPHGSWAHPQIWQLELHVVHSAAVTQSVRDGHSAAEIEKAYGPFMTLQARMALNERFLECRAKPALSEGKSCQEVLKRWGAQRLGLENRNDLRYLAFRNDPDGLRAYEQRRNITGNDERQLDVEGRWARLMLAQQSSHCSEVRTGHSAALSKVAEYAACFGELGQLAFSGRVSLAWISALSFEAMPEAVLGYIWTQGVQFRDSSTRELVAASNWHSRVKLRSVDGKVFTPIEAMTHFVDQLVKDAMASEAP